MKKILAFLGVIVVSTGVSFAVIHEDKTSDIDVLRQQGFSESALQVVDIAKFHNQAGKYKKQFSKKSQGVYSTLKVYVDPIQDDGDFGEHQVNFSNTWKGNETNYSSSKEVIENL